MIKRLHHTGFVVRDLEGAIEFYRDVVGLKLQRQYERTGLGIDQVVGYENTHLRVAILVAGGDHALELIQYMNPLPEGRQTEERSVLGATHLSLLVDDIKATFRKLTDNGASILNPPAELEPGRKGCYLQDPEGNWVELLELNG